MQVSKEIPEINFKEHHAVTLRTERYYINKYIGGARTYISYNINISENTLQLLKRSKLDA